MALTPTESDISIAFENLSIISNSENTICTEYEPKIVKAIKEIRNKKKRPDTDAIFDYISRLEASNIDIKTIDSVIQDCIKRKTITNKKTPQGLDSFYVLSENPITQDENEQNDELLKEDFELVNVLATLNDNNLTTLTDDNKIQKLIFKSKNRYQ